jgi:DNA-binding MarR family transcriptional regulator
MVDRLVRAGLVCSTPDPQDRRRVHLTIATTATPIISNINQDTATRLQEMLNNMSPQNRRQLVDILRESIQQFTEEPGYRPPAVPL